MSHSSRGWLRTRLNGRRNERLTVLLGFLRVQERQTRTPRWRGALLLSLLLLGAGGFANGQSSAADRVRATADTLQAAYNPTTGLFDGTGWWNSANGITALADASRVLHLRSYDATFANTLTAAPHRFPGFLNEFYDDEGWWALAWLDVYSLRHEPRYLHMAETIFADMTGGWSSDCGGGIWWKKNEHYKNAIANELFLAVAVGLAREHAGQQRAADLEWAKREEQWFVASGMLNEKGLVNDGLDAACHNNGRTTWSYNQGVLLLGLTGYSELTRQPEARTLATRVALAANVQLTDSGRVLHDPCEPHCGADGVQFKGIFFRDLMPLLASAPSPVLAGLVEANADSVWNRARTTGNQFSTNWAGPPVDDGTGSLISALDVLNAAAISVPGSSVPPASAAMTRLPQADAVSQYLLKNSQSSQISENHRTP